VGLYLLRHS